MMYTVHRVHAVLQHDNIEYEIFVPDNNLSFYGKDISSHKEYSAGTLWTKEKTLNGEQVYAFYFGIVAIGEIRWPKKYDVRHRTNLRS